MSQRRAARAAATGARILLGGLLAVACVLGVSAAVAVPWPGVRTEPAQTAVTPASGDATLVCMGAFRALGREATAAAQLSVAAPLALTVGGTSERVEAVLPATDLAGAPTAPLFIGPAVEGRVPLLAAAESSTLAAEDLSGLASAACREPRTQSWLIGGAVSTGSNDLVVLSNPGDVSATVSVTVFGEEQVTSTLVVPAGTQLSVPLASWAAGVAQPVLRVSAAGSPVRASLQSSLVRVLAPAGIDLQDSAGPPEPHLTFAGVQVLTGSGDTSAAVLRLLAPDEDTTAVITTRAVGDPAAAVPPIEVALQAGVPVEVDLGALAPGTYLVEAQAEAPLVGAVWQSSGAGAGTDFAWMTPAPELSGEVAVAVPAGPSPELHLVNGGATEVAVTVTPLAGGPAAEVIVPPGTAVFVPVAPESGYRLDAAGPLHAAVTFSAPHALAGWPVWPGGNAAAPITVYP